MQARGEHESDAVRTAAREPTRTELKAVAGLLMLVCASGAHYAAGSFERPVKTAFVTLCSAFLLIYSAPPWPLAIHVYPLCCPSLPFPCGRSKSGGPWAGPIAS